MFRSLLITIYLLAVAYAVAAGIFNRKLLDRPARTFAALLACTLVSEITSLILSYTMGNNMLVFHSFAVLQLTLTIAYFLQLHGQYRIRTIIAVFVIAATLAWLNSLYVELLKNKELNSNFLMMESIIIIILSVIALYRIMDDEAVVKPTQNVHFWIWGFLLILWSATFFWWGLYKYIRSDTEIRIIANNIRILLNIVVYAGIGIALLKLPKHEHGQ